MLTNFCIIDKESTTSIYIQLYDQLKEGIIDGTLPMESKLPSIREVANHLSISKTTVETAYAQLDMEGYIFSKPKVGYFVSNLSHSQWHNSHEQKQLIELPNIIESTPIRYDFGDDFIDRNAFNFTLWKKYINQTFQQDTDHFFTYHNGQGALALRKEICHYLHQSRNVKCQPEQIIIGAGSQMLLHLLCGLLKPSHTRIGFEEPGFRQGRYVFTDHQFEVIPIHLKKDGIDLDELSSSTANLVYVSPSNQFPTGAVMPIKKRLQLLDWAKEHGNYIIEDDYDSELRYFGRPLPSLQGLDTSSSVIYLGSFSKILLPALRISYLVLPASLLPILNEKIQYYNQTASLIEQLALARFMAEGQLTKHIRKTRKIYAKKNQLLIEWLESTMGEHVNILGKETGLHLLLEIKTEKTTEKVIDLAKEVGIKLTSINNFSINQTSSRYPLVLMSYGGIAMEEIEPAVKLLHSAWFGKSDK